MNILIFVELGKGIAAIVVELDLNMSLFSVLTSTSTTMSYVPAFGLMRPYFHDVVSTPSRFLFMSLVC